MFFLCCLIFTLFFHPNWCFCSVELVDVYKRVVKEKNEIKAQLESNGAHDTFVGEEEKQSKDTNRYSQNSLVGSTGCVFVTCILDGHGQSATVGSPVEGATRQIFHAPEKLRGTNRAAGNRITKYVFAIIVSIRIM